MFPSSPINSIFRGLLYLCSVLSAFLVMGIISFISLEAFPSIKSVAGGFFTDAYWGPTAGQFNLMPMLIGSLFMSFCAVVVALPLAISIASAQAFYLKGLPGTILEVCIDLLAGIPSVVFGLWGLTQLVPLLYHLNPPGVGLLAGTIVLTIMIVPTITIIVRKSFETTAPSIIESCQALAISPSSMIRSIILPMHRRSIFGATLLGLGRALGETIAVLMVIGNIPRVPSSIFDPVRSLTSNIALEMAYALGDHRSALFTNALILIAAIALITLTVRISMIGWGLRRA